MQSILRILTLLISLAICAPVIAAPLIVAKEAALPPAAGVLATRGISRGPSIKMASPEPDVAVSSPLDFKVIFEARGGDKIDPSSVKVIYMKSPFFAGLAILIDQIYILRISNILFNWRRNMMID